MVPASTFSITLVIEFNFVGINIAADDNLFNLLTKNTQLIRGITSWRRSRKKDTILLEMLIEPTTQVGNIVLDCTVSIGKDFLPNFFIKVF